MMAWVASVVVVTPQSICALSIRSVRNENGTGGSSPGCISRLGPVDRAPVEARRRAGLEAAEPQLERQQALGEAVGRRLAVAAGRGLLLAAMDQAAQERAGGEHHRAGADAPAIGRDDAGHRAVRRPSGPRPPPSITSRLGVARIAACMACAVELAVGLGARALHGRPLGAVEQAELDAGRVGHPAHQAVQRVDLAHQVALAEPADGRVAGHLADGREAGA